MVPMVVPETIIFTKGNGSLFTASTTLPFKDARCARLTKGIKMIIIIILIVFMTFFSMCFYN
jgi:hypothetical protein